MCGIAGIVGEATEENRRAVVRMLEAIRHRGPDGEGVDLADGAILGHRRLSIVDLAAGAQPMRDHSGRRCISFNGEIYGYRRIRATTEYPYRTESDTEVILALYEAHGEGLLDHLPGMFAFALWDEGRSSLFCARDRFGEKPLYYAFSAQGELIFGSEIKAILASEKLQARISEAALAHYLRRLTVPAEATIYENVFVLPPAHAMRYEGGRLHVWRYWDFPQVDESMSLAQAVEGLGERLADAVRRQLVADVEVGAFLSGGLDSTTVVGLASGQGAGLRTFAFGFETERSELPFAEVVAREYGTRHASFVDHEEKLADTLVDLQAFYDEPFADSSNVPTYLISRYAAAELKVVLSGDGADELLGGYTFWYRFLSEIENRRRRGGVGLLVEAMVCALLHRLRPGRGADDRCAVARAASSGRPLSSIQDARRSYFGREELAALGFDTVPPLPGAGYDDVAGALRHDTRHYLAADILTKTDRASMANGLELRAPFLDVEVASFLLSVPLRFKLDGREDKKLLRACFAHGWPQVVRERGKQGFGAPVWRWLRMPGFRALKQRVFEEHNKLRDLFPAEALRPFAQADDYRTWILLVLGLWLERWQ